jgi:sigma-B regulation protein RsbU (phosphoserine phosphatase)
VKRANAQPDFCRFKHWSVFAACLNWLAQWQSKSAKQAPACGCNCDEHSREAKLIQSSLLPTQGLCHESVEIVFRFVPFSEVGGDFLDFFRLPDGFIGIYLGDVVGKGLPAAMYAALVTGTLRGIHKTGTDTASALARLNERLLAASPAGTLLLDLVRALRSHHAGTHLLQRRNAPALARLRNRVPAVRRGWLAPGTVPRRSLRTARHATTPGNSVLFATDGLHELLDPDGVEFCTTRMEQVWAQCGHRSATESADFVFVHQAAFSNGIMPHDDVTAVVLKVLL